MLICVWVHSGFPEMSDGYRSYRNHYSALGSLTTDGMMQNRPPFLDKLLQDWVLYSDLNIKS